MTINLIEMCGLVLNKSRDYIASSVDGLCVIQCGENHTRTIAACVEIKTHTAGSKISGVAAELTKSYGNISFTFISNGELDANYVNTFRRRFGFKDHFNIVDVIPNPEYRSQVLHHASTFHHPVV